MPERYKPATQGRLDNAEQDPALEIALKADTPVISIGEPLYLDVAIRNVSEERVWLPRQPTVLVSWIYPNGVHDNFLKEIREEEHLERSELVCLEPGQQIAQRVEIRTYYFDRPGITEFRARLYGARNTNPKTAETWTGRLQSNSFGVMVERAKKKMSDYRIVTGACPDGPGA
ncbi:MAG TPA: hypothetical protein P5567_11780 [Kiritimatiellia bacterium]|nr:hypothetical protein [Kiritimatiellia bacterium]HRZ13120.1 hypothetical protein [Kiritimatiellia bacterium]HSA17541.1 hypothetical protein [Kiritimatiellia bacterium]